MIGRLTITPWTGNDARSQVMTLSSHLIEILIVEDDLGDIDLVQEAFESSQFAVNLNIVRDGVSAIAFLRKEGEYASAVLPDLILLDLNLPRMGGQEVLKVIKSDDNLKHIPVIVFTTSDLQEDIVKAYQLGANCYINKPLGLEEFLEVIRLIEYYWFTIVKLPTPRNQ